MTAAEYRAALRTLGLYRESDRRPVYDCNERMAKMLRMGERQVHAYWLGHAPIPYLVGVVINDLLAGRKTIADFSKGGK